MEGSLVATHPQIAVAFTFLIAASMYLFFKVVYLTHSMDTLYIYDRYNTQRIFELEVEVYDLRKNITENKNVTSEPDVQGDVGERNMDS